MPENWTVKNLLEKHASRLYNPDIANALFRSGYIESCGRGAIKIIRERKQAGIPEPVFSNDSSDIFIEFRKDIYNEKYLSSLGLNERQLDALIYFKSKGEIGSSEYLNRYDVTDRTARYDLTDLVQRKLLIKYGDKKSTKYIFPIKNRDRLCFADSLVQAESSVLRMKFSAKKPAIRVAANRYENN